MHGIETLGSLVAVLGCAVVTVLVLRRIGVPAIAGLFFEGGVSESRLVLEPPHELPGSDAAIIYRVYAESAPVAAMTPHVAASSPPVIAKVSLRSVGWDFRYPRDWMT